MEKALEILIYAFTSFLTLFIIAKILGKKQISQLDFIDYVVGISIGSIAAEMATNSSDKPIYLYLISLFVYFISTIIVDILSNKTNFFKKLLKGSPIIIIKDGKIDYQALKKSKLSIDDLSCLIREKDIFNIDDIAYAIFEISGKLTILPKFLQAPVVKEDLNLKQQQVAFPMNVIVDGRVSKTSLKILEKTKEWLFENIKVKNEKEIKNILLCVYNQANNEFTIYYK